MQCSSFYARTHTRKFVTKTLNGCSHSVCVCVTHNEWQNSLSKENWVCKYTHTNTRSLARSLSLAIRLWGVSISLKMYSIYVSVYFFCRNCTLKSCVWMCVYRRFRYVYKARDILMFTLPLSLSLSSWMPQNVNWSSSFLFCLFCIYTHIAWHCCTFMSLVRYHS